MEQEILKLCQPSTVTEVASGSESQATEELGDQQSQESTEDTKPQLETPPKSPEPKQLQ